MWLGFKAAADGMIEDGRNRHVAIPCGGFGGENL
jgi:hypothetical protein